MVEFIDDLISVDVHLRQDGTVVPLGFAWRGRHYRVASWGRESVEHKEGRDYRCYLVQTEGLETWELCQDTETAQWVLTRRWPRSIQAV